MMTKPVFPLAILCLALSGCTTTVTNLTAGSQKRNPAGLYPFEVMLDATQQSLRKETLKPYVIIGVQSYPMEPTPLLKNRWETVVPIPANQEFVNYRYKFDYEYNSIPNRREGSKLSEPYQLRIVD